MIHLTGHHNNAREIIQNTFSPLVGVISSPLASEVCHRNNLSFVEMLQPFAKLINDAHFRDVSGTSVSIKGLRLNFCDVDWRPPQTVLARRMLNEAVTNAHNEKTKFLTVGKLELELPTAEPWFEHWRETFLTVQFPSDHEFTRHFLSCLIVLSSGDSNIVDTAHKLTQRVQQMQSMTPQKLPKWLHPSNVLNSYVVLHEGCQGDLSKAQQGYELLKSTFGDSKCFLLQFNSLDGTVSGEIPDYWTPFIKRQPKPDAQADQLSGPKTPQDMMSVISMPTIQMSALSEAIAAGAENLDVSILHPLSPVQENATEAITSKFSISSESIASQTINPNVWSSELDADTASHGSCLNAMDVENLRHFVQDYSVRALIPYVEHLVANLAEAITNKKGVSKSLLSATKRWFVTSKPGTGTSNQNAVIYTHESAELQTRKLGDLYFMFGHYNLAFQAYHQAKRDFNADSAWQYYAGALEMAAISAFMLGTANRKTYDYMEDAIMCYLTVCKLQQFATRATLLSIECLKTARLYGEAAKQLIRMTSEESDLRSALLLEQAAYCFLASNPSMHRKYAFNIVLSGNRFSRAGQRKHAYRCYQQAYQVFHARGWSLAEDHIQYTMAKQAYALKKLEDASRSFSHLLHPDSLQSAQQQISFLKEYIQTQNELIKRNPELGLLPHALPQIIQKSVRVLLLAQPPIVSPQHVAASGIDIKADLSEEHVWQKIEEMIVVTAAAKKPFVFKPSRCLFTKEHPATDYPLAVQGEPIEIAVTIFNTVKCSITLNGIDVLWKLKLDNDEMLSNECLYEDTEQSPSKAAVGAALKTACIASVVLEERAEKTLFFKITPKLTGLLSIIGMVAEVVLTVEPVASLLGSLHFETPQIKPLGKQSTQTLLDNKLAIKVTPSVPSLGVSFSVLPMDLMAGEIIPVTISLRNSGIIPIGEIFLGCDNPRWITLVDKDAEVPLSILSSVKDLSNEKFVKDREIRRQRVFRLLKNDSGISLRPQEGTTLPIYIQAPFQEGDFTLRLLFYYSLPNGSSSYISYRLVRHSWKFRVHQCLRSEVTCVVSNMLSGELGLNVSLKNESSNPQAAVKELCLNSLSLYSADYKLNSSKLYFMNQMEVNVGPNGERCLQTGKSMSFQCRLEKRDAVATSNLPMANVLPSRLSSLNIMPTRQTQLGHVPPLDEIYGFLAKHETVFFSTYINSDELNNLLASQHKHITVVLHWTASVQMPTADARIASGQHFVQLHNLYEGTSCLDTLQSQLSKDPNMRSICGFSPVANPFEGRRENTKDDDEDSGYGRRDDDNDITEFWEPNSYFVGRRCLLEDESFAQTVKG